MLVSIGFAVFITRNYFPSNRLQSTKILDIHGKWRDFIAEKAMSHMDNIAVHRRPHNSLAHKQIIDYIQATLVKYQVLATANAKMLQLGGVDNIMYTDVDELDHGEKRGLFVETSNILVRLNGRRYVVGGPSLLINVNFDSAPASFGAGSKLVISLWLFRIFTNYHFNYRKRNWYRGCVRNFGTAHYWRFFGLHRHVLIQ
jgi:hypothetical protein